MAYMILESTGVFLISIWMDISNKTGFLSLLDKVKLRSGQASGHHCAEFERHNLRDVISPNLLHLHLGLS